MSKKSAVFYISRVMIGFLSIIVYLVGELTTSLNYMVLGIFLLFLALLFKFCNRKAVAVFAFLICFDMFLLNRVFLAAIDSNVTINLSHNTEIMTHLYRCLFIALLGLDIGVVLKKQRLKRSVRFERGFANTENKNLKSDSYIRMIRSVAKALFYCTAVFNVAVYLEKIIYVVMVGGYFEYYIDFASSLPFVVRKIADFNDIFFMVYLATLPNPKEEKSPFVIFFLFGILGLMYGQRNHIMVRTIFLFVYFILYENIHEERHLLIKRRYYLYAIIALPLLMIFMDFISYARAGLDYNVSSVFSSISDFLAKIGNSIRTIIYGYYFRDSIRTDRIYSIGGIVEFFKNNIIVLLFSEGSTYGNGQTVALAKEGWAFSAAVTYQYSQTSYLNGFGLGSSYIAETFHDFGYIGVVICSALYGWILSSIQHLAKNRWIVNSILLISFFNLLMAPRDSACSFITAFFNYQFIFVIFIVYAIVNVKYRNTST